MTDYEVCVIGGSLAGSACVRELTRLGIDAVAFEKDRFPRNKVCGGFISPGGVSCLDQLGVLQSVKNAGATSIRSARIQAGGVNAEINFRNPGGLGISRKTLDAILANYSHVHQGRRVHQVVREGRKFILIGDTFEASCAVLIDAAGKLSRFTPRKTVEEFGIQYEEPEPRGSTMDFWFSRHGYGGAVTIEGGRSNFCYLVRKDKLSLYLEKHDCHVTGPLAYERLPSDYIAIGDANGMVDPFCGEGMRHAMDTGIIAAQTAARGIRNRRTYEEIREDYDCEWRRRWDRRRGLASAFRTAARWEARGLKIHPVLLSGMFRLWERYSE